MRLLTNGGICFRIDGGWLERLIEHATRRLKIVKTLNSELRNLTLSFRNLSNSNENYNALL